MLTPYIADKYEAISKYSIDKSINNDYNEIFVDDISKIQTLHSVCLSKLKQFGSLLSNHFGVNIS